MSEAPPTETRAEQSKRAEKEALIRLLDRTANELEQICNLLQEKGGDTRALANARQSIGEACGWLNKATEPI